MNLTHANGKVKRTISLAPLVDIVFILLIFFVLESTLNVFNEVKVDFPATREASNRSESVSGLSVQVFGLQRVWVSGRTMTMEQFRSYLDENDLSRSIPVRLELSGEAPVQAAVFVLDILQEYGLNNISLGPVRE